ncbi:unnamed protein product [Euphydryas editha]|uniref:Uncharacterized protein n=1 Tax=Euphydryas editha TaxID=104508 RepID=A0AAU9TR44_EUPED|nr:unnamed protein product [Euphydryas editha]
MKVAILEAQANGDEDKIKQEHGETETLVHFPPKAGYADDDEDQHGEEQYDAADHALRVDSDRFPVYQTIEEPRQRQPENM